MIISWISGGLGNQMFQYALGHALSIKNRDIHLLDLSAYKTQVEIDTPRAYELSVFGIENMQAANRDIKQLSQPSRLLSLMNRYLHTRTSVYPASYLREKNFGYHPQVLNKQGNIYLYGYWQSWKYFDKYQDEMRELFTFRDPLKKINQKLLRGIDNNSVAIHVRRGDYVHSENANAFHGVCDVEYYHKAIAYMKSKINKPKFYIFSDDITWCRKNLSLPRTAVFVDHNQGQSSWEDMQLMSKCAHNIIANSSFSWWGAWLNKNTSKIVIAPSVWFRDQTIDTSDLIPESWIRI